MWRGSRRAKKEAIEHTKFVHDPTDVRAKLLHSRVAQRRVKIRLLKISLIILIIISFIGGLSWLSFSDILAINKIVITGNSEIKTKALQASMLVSTDVPIFFLFSKQNIILYPSAKITRMLGEKFPKIKTVKIDNDIMKKQILVSITERKPYALWCRGFEEERTCYYIDKNGFVFQKIQQQNIPNNLIIFNGGITEQKMKMMRSLVSPKYFAEVRKFITALKAIDLKPKVFIFNGNDAQIELAKNWELRVALDKNLSEVPANLEIVLEKDNMRERLKRMKYIDMRFDGRVYYKYKGSH